MACRQCHQLLASGAKDRIGRDDECAGLPLGEGCESGIDLVFGGGLEDSEPHPRRARRFLHSRDQRLVMCSRTVRVYQQGNNLGLRHQLGEQLEPFRHQLDGEEVDAGQIAARPG